MLVSKKIIILVFFLCAFYQSPVVLAQGQPLRIVSLSPAITEEIFLLQAEDMLVGVTSYCQRPKQAQQKQIVGTVTGVSLEKIIELEPDIVLTTPLTDRKAVEHLKNLGITVENFPLVKNFEQICSQIIRLGEITGKKNKAEQIALNARQELERIRAIVTKEGGIAYKVFVQIGAEPLFTVNKDYFINDMVELAGGINIAKDAGSGLYSREKVIEADPDFIIIASMGIVTEKEKRIWQKYPSLKAVRLGRIGQIDSEAICSPNPQSFVSALDDIVKFMYGGQKNI
ncbi:MAG: ABC transporter substrate-binding protein [Candidatus Omnitrophica bacterium]|nr:ABC transporter substrate-binding protein [Candidatus Omnitrophota bacterium]